MKAIISALILLVVGSVPGQVRSQERSLKADQPEFNQVFVKIILPAALANGDKEQPIVESWIAENLNKLGQAKFTAVTGWVPLDLSPLETTEVWDGKLGETQFCPMHADIERLEDATIKVCLGGYSPVGASWIIPLKDEPGSREIAVAGEDAMEFGYPYVAVLIGPPAEKPAAPNDRQK